MWDTHYHYGVGEDQLCKLDRKIDKLLKLLGEIIMPHLDEITAKVTKIEGASDSIIQLVTDLADEIRHNAGDAAALADLANRLDAKAEAIAAAVVANPDPTPNVPPTE